MNLNPDILVIGAGSAGLAAVSTAVRNSDCSILIIEKLSEPGGKATSAYVGTLCGLFYTKPGEPEWAVNGLVRQFAEELQQRSKTTVQTHGGKLHFLPYHRQSFVDGCHELLNHPNVEVAFNAGVTGISFEQNVITGVEINTNGVAYVIHPRVVIDCSGISLSTDLTGMESVQDRNYQAAAQVFSISGIAYADVDTVTLALGRAVRTGMANGHLSEDISQISVVKGMCSDGTALLKLGIPLQTDHSVESQQVINDFAGNAIHELVNFLKNQGGIFSNIRVDFMAPEAGIRTGPRNKGRYMLTGEDVLSCRKFYDGIAKGTWPVEFWAPGKKVEMQYFVDGDFYHIPARSIQSEKFDNLFFAGRNISADETAIASARVIGTCMQTGSAAAHLAVGYLRKDCIQETIHNIQAEWTA